MKCCGSERVGKFCSECGGKLVTPLGELLKYLRHTASLRTEAEQRRREDEAGYRKRGKEQEAEIQKSRAITEYRNAKKFTAWADALSSLLADQEPKP